MDANKVNIPSNIDLADKDFGIPGEIDMLIGCELFFDLLRPNKFRSPSKNGCFKRLFSGTLIQILINPGHRNLQMILWKDSVDGPVQTYKLNTVTYGTTCAAYLASRTIQQLARDEGEHYPLAASVTIRDIYMDDILTGSSDFQEFQKL
ncbi:DUF1758 domain-containing protein [Trichonephila clavipes]|nr:DUF1758 domain-containing protein [Trichonephila clavipes]